MKRFSLVILLSLLVLAFGSVNAGITLDTVTNLQAADKIHCGVPVEFHLRWTSQPDIAAGDVITANSNGFQLYDGGTGTLWSYPVDASWNADVDWAAMYDGGRFVNMFPSPLGGQGTDTIGFGGFRISGPGIPDGFDSVFAIITIEVACSETDKQICIDSSWYPPRNPWLWDAADAGQIFDVSWDGPHCFTIGDLGTSVEDGVNGILPKVFALKQNYPNPFNPATNISFDVPSKSHVKISVYNILGQRVAVPLDQDMTAGSHQVEWNAAKEGVSSGVYFFKMEAGDFVQTKKMMLLK